MTFGVVVAGGRLEVGGVTFVGSTLGMVEDCGACTLEGVTLEMTFGNTADVTYKAVNLENAALDGASEKV